eukprot:4674577-Prymnesium_polylepis.1
MPQSSPATFGDAQRGNASYLRPKCVASTGLICMWRRRGCCIAWTASSCRSTRGRPPSSPGLASRGETQ